MAFPSPGVNVKTNVSTPDLGRIPRSSSTPGPNSDMALATTESTFPSASLFTFLPELYLVISRLRELRATPDATTTSADGLIQVISRDSIGSIHPVRSDPQSKPIETRELPGQVFPIRQGIANAKQVVKALPDITRSIEEQEAEMKELKNSVQGLKMRLRELGAIAQSSGTEDVPMQGMGG